jgi:hypothetical protein
MGCFHQPSMPFRIWTKEEERTRGRSGKGEVEAEVATKSLKLPKSACVSPKRQIAKVIISYNVLREREFELQTFRFHCAI